MAADRQLLDYLRNGLQQGNSIESLRSALLSEGWDAAEVEDAIVEVRGGTPLPAAEPPGIPEEVTALPERNRGSHRPAGVTVIGILGIILSLIILLGGVAAVWGSLLLGPLEGSGVLTAATDEGLAAGLGAALFAGMGQALLIGGLVLVVLGAAGLIGSILLLKMRKAGLCLTVIIGAISIIQNLQGMLALSISPLVSTVFWAIIIIYLLKKRKLFL